MSDTVYGEQPGRAERRGNAALFTIGFTQSSAEHFFGRLIRAGVRRVIDVRLNNTSNLAGFAKARDLPYLLRALGGIDYVHEPLLAPTADMLGDYRAARAKRQPDAWDTYRVRFLDLMRERRIDQRIDPAVIDGGCLLCSEATPHHCHRRLVAEYLAEHWRDGSQRTQPLAVDHL